MERIPTPWKDTNRLRMMLTACMILLLVTSGSLLVVAQLTNYTEGWEDNSFDGYTTAAGTNGVNEIQQADVNSGLYALRQEVGDAGGSVSATTTTNDTYRFTPGEAVNVSYHTRAEWQVDENQQDFMWLRIVDEDTGDVILQVRRHEFDSSFFSGPDRGWIMHSDVMNVNEAEEEGAMSAVESGNTNWQEVTVTSEGNGTDLVLTVDGQELLTATNDAPVDGEYNGTIQYRTRRTDGTGGSSSVQSWFDDIDIEATPVPDRSLDLRVDSFMRHGATEHYSVVFDNVTSSSDVTSQANVSSSNTSVISVDESAGTITSTSITSIDQEVTLTANYTGPDGNLWEDEENVTVASPTMDNWAILPSWVRIEAMFSFSPGDGVETNMVWIILAVLTGMAFTTIASSFAGIGVTTLIVIIGWFWGQAGGVSTVGTGVMLAALFGGLFIGLNLAANIDYAMTRGGGVEG